MHNRNLAIWLPWREKEEAEAAVESKALDENWVQEEHKLKNERQEIERPEEKVSRLLNGMDIKRSIL